MANAKKGNGSPVRRKGGVLPLYSTKNVPIDSLVPMEPDNNPRIHDARNQEGVRDSLDRYNQVEPLVVQQGTGKIIHGNNRYHQMAKIGFREVLVLEVPVDDGDIPGMALVLNRTGELGGWNDRLVAGILKEATRGEESVPGFSDADVASFIESFETERVMLGGGDRDLTTFNDDDIEELVENREKRREAEAEEGEEGDGDVDVCPECGQTLPEEEDEEEEES